MSEDSTRGIPAKPVEDSNLQVSRRALLKAVFGFLGACGLGALFYGTYRFLAPGASSAPVEVPLSEISAGGTHRFQYGGAPGLLFRGEDGTFRALSLVCTHLACTVLWKPEKNEFFCPCHDGFFDEEGRVVSGPPPGPLERWRVEVKGDRVVIGGA